MNQSWLSSGNHLKVTIRINQLWLALGGYLERVGKRSRLWLGLADLGSRTDWCPPNVRDKLGIVGKMSWLTPGLFSHLRTISGISQDGLTTTTEMNQPWQGPMSCSAKTDKPTLSLATRTPGILCRVMFRNNLSGLGKQVVYLEHWSAHTGLATFYQVN